MKMRKSTCYLLIALVLLSMLLPMLSAETVRYTVRPIKDGNALTNTQVDYQIKLTTDSSCNNVVAQKSQVVNLNKYGDATISIDLPEITPSTIPRYVCEYRNGALVQVQEFGNVFGGDISGEDLTISGDADITGNINASRGFMQLAWEYIDNLPDLIYDLWSDYNANNLLVSNGTNIGYNESVFNDSVIIVGDTTFLRNDGDIGVGNYEFRGTFKINDSSESPLTFSSFASDFSQNSSTHYNVHSNNSNGGNSAWNVGGNNLTSENGQAIRANLMDGNNVNQRLQGNFNISGLPDNFEENGFALRIVKRWECFFCLFSNQTFTDEEVYLTKNGNIVGDNKADTSTIWGFNFFNSTYGEEGDDWNAGIDLDTDTIGFAFSMDSFGASDNFDGDIPAVDLVELIVYGASGAEYTFKLDPVNNEFVLSEGDKDSDVNIFRASQSKFNITSDTIYVKGAFEVCHKNGNCEWGNLSGTQGDYLYNNGTDVFFNSTLNNETITQIASASGGGGGGWTASADVVYNNSAGINVSIGTDYAPQTLHLKGTFNVTDIAYFGSDVNLLDNKNLYFGNSSTGRIFWDTNVNALSIQVN